MCMRDLGLTAGVDFHLRADVSTGNSFDKMITDVRPNFTSLAQTIEKANQDDS